MYPETKTFIQEVCGRFRKLLLASSPIDSKYRYISIAVEFMDCHRIPAIQALLNQYSKVYFCAEPEEGMEVLSIGYHEAVSFSHANAQERIDSFLSGLSARILKCGERDRSLPLFYGAFRFDDEKNDDVWQDFPCIEIILPEFVLITRENRTRLVVNLMKEHLADPESVVVRITGLLNMIYGQNDKHSVPQGIYHLERTGNDIGLYWFDAVHRIKDKIQSGIITKAVLSARFDYHLESPINFDHLFSSLRAKSAAYKYLYKSKESVFLGATPELLFKADGTILYTEAVAGTVRRGKSDAEDKILAQYLSESVKELEEHNIVVQYLRENIHDYAKDISNPKQPIIKKLGSIQHLWTPINAKVVNQIPLIKLVLRLAPTPATGGFPKQQSLDVISDVEPHKRGLYAGVLGFWNDEGFGEFIVPLRSALLKENAIFVYAGCGIVKDSDPEKELNETELKAKSVLSLFND